MFCWKKLNRFETTNENVSFLYDLLIYMYTDINLPV